MRYTARQSFRNITAFAKYQFCSLIFPSDSFVNLGFPNCKQRLSLSNLTNSASVQPLSAKVLLLHTNNNDRARRKGEVTTALTTADHCLLQTDQLCTWTKCAQWHWLCSCGESTPLHCRPRPAPHQPHDNLLKLCIAISSLSDFRLQWEERQLAHESRTRLYWMLTAAA